MGPSADGYANAEPARPSLEDGYVWLMKNAHENVASLVGAG
ncbi:MAG: hypothetical protein U0V87_05125 [Acidobacteriota bacterium]